MSLTNRLKIMITIATIIIPLKIVDIKWWIFVIPLFLFGMLIGLKRWKIRTFSIGFFVGFSIWLVANISFYITGGSIAMTRISDMLAIPEVILILFSSILGGFLTGLALFSGHYMFSTATPITLD